MSVKRRLYEVLIERGLAENRSQARTLIDLGKVRVNRQTADSPNNTVDQSDVLGIIGERYVSRAAYKLASVTEKLNLSFKDKIVLDVGSSAGGFTDYALQHGAKKVIAVDVGTDQLHPSLRGDPRIELHEQTDIRDFAQKTRQNNDRYFGVFFDVVVIDVSFISLREVLPSVMRLSGAQTQIVAMAKPQFEAGAKAKHKGVIKNDKMRRNTLKELEIWIQKLFKIAAKADSDVTGAKGNQERFYVLKVLQK